MPSLLRISFVLLVCLAGLPTVLFAQFESLTQSLPSSANAVAFVNVDKLMNTPLAEKENWKAKREFSFSSGVSFLPPDAKYAVLGMEMDLQLWVPMWEAAVIELNHTPQMDKVVAMTGGAMDSIGGRAAVGLPEDAYVVMLGEQTASFMAPANRQSVARWMREIDTRTKPQLSPYLMEAYRYANDIGTPVILALDMEDAVTASGIQQALEAEASLSFLKTYKLDAARVARVLAGIRGITLGITFADRPFGKIRVDFRDDLTLPPETAKAALLHALSNHGAMIDEFEEWKPAVNGKTITLEGYLGASGMQRLSTLFDRPPTLKPREATIQQTPKTQEQLTVEASQAYFKRVNELLNDLKQEKKSSGSYTIGAIGVWMDRYATKIDQLSVLNVDPDLVNYGMQVSDMLRQAYNSIRSGAGRARIREVNTPMQYDYYSYGTTYGYTYRANYFGAGYVPWGNYGTVAVPNQYGYRHERTRARTEERVTSANEARDIVEQIKGLTGDVRRKMTQKYMVDF